MLFLGQAHAPRLEQQAEALEVQVTRDLGRDARIRYDAAGTRGGVGAHNDVLAVVGRHLVEQRARVEALQQQRRTLHSRGARMTPS